MVSLGVTALLGFGALDAEDRRSWVQGLVDPIAVLDHLMVLVGIGLGAGKLGGSALWRLPAVFLIGGLAGFVLAGDQPSVPLIDALVRLLVIGSVLLVGMGLMFPISLPLRDAISMAVLIGACHGYLHRLEVGTAEVIWFGLGSVVSAAALMAVGGGHRRSKAPI